MHQTNDTQTTIFNSLSLTLIGKTFSSVCGCNDLAIIYHLCNPFSSTGESVQRLRTLGLKIQPLQNQYFFQRFSYYLSWVFKSKLTKIVVAVNFA